MSGRRNYGYSADYDDRQRDSGGAGGSSSRGKWGKKIGKKLKKADKDDGNEAEFTVETPPDGGMTAWTGCLGSAVLTSCNAVVRASLNESVESINEEFNKNSENYTTCYNGILSALNSTPGLRDNPLVAQCLSLGNPAFYDCMAEYATSTAGDPPPVLEQVCPGLYKLFTSALDLVSDQPTALRLTAGNIESPPIPTDVDDIGGVMNFTFVCLSFFCMIIAAILSVFLGYRVVSIVGSILIAVGFIVASFLEEDQKVLAEILVGGVAGIGSSFVRYAAIVAILEYFNELRMRAIVISGLGAVLINFLVIGLTFVDSISFEWKKTFKFQAIPAGISLVTSLIMKPLKHKSRDRSSRGGNSCSRKCSDRICSGELFRDIVLYLVMFVFFLDQLGRPIFSEGMQPIMGDKGFSETQIDIQPLIENGGSLVGLLALLLWKRHSLGANLAVMAAMDILIGLLALHVPEMTAFAWAAAYSAIFGFTEGVFNSVIQDAIPEGFQRHHIKMVAGILGFIAGVGSVVSSFVGDAIDKRGDGNRVSYYFAGACLLACAAFALISRLIVVRRQEPPSDDLELDSIGHDERRQH